MLRRFVRFFAGLLIMLILVGLVLFKSVDRTAYEEMAHFHTINERLDSMAANYQPSSPDTLRLGFSKLSIQPSDTVPLAGYAIRKPKEFARVLDSVYVRSLVIRNSHEKLALISTELLINHPYVVALFHEKLKSSSWRPEEVFLGATHSHSAPGGWAPGVVGSYISGKFDEEQAHFIANQMYASLIEADKKLKKVQWTYMASEMGIHVKNRLVPGGDEDSWLRHIFFESEEGVVSFSTYAAHATCFSLHTRALTGDYPSYFYRHLSRDSLNLDAMFMAGAMGSMAPHAEGLKGQQKARLIGSTLAGQVSMLTRLGAPYKATADLHHFRLRIPMRSPQLKVSKNIALRSWVFRWIMGSYPVEISGLKIGNTVLLGMPCDFSGEVALPLYQYAEQRGLHLIITSFNGDYIGYVTKDDWYDLGEYETRSMNWYGPDSGAYFQFIVQRIIDMYANENSV
jgi:hypothetical protein